MSDVPGVTDTGPRGTASAVVMALVVMVLGAFVSYDSVTGLTGPGYAQIGPGVFPVIVGGGLILAGIGLLTQTIRGPWRVVWTEGSDTPAPSHQDDSQPLRNVMLVAAALALNVMLFGSLGFIAASTVLFTCVAYAFGSRRIVLDLAIGAAFATAIYLVFALGLGLQLPVGDLWMDIPWTP